MGLTQARPKYFSVFLTALVLHTEPMTFQHSDQVDSFPMSSSLVDTSGIQHHVKVAILHDTDSSVAPLLMELDRKYSLTVILRDVCSRWGIENPERYSFMYADSNSTGAAQSQTKYGYITEENRLELRNGDILCIKLAPSLQAWESLMKISTGDFWKKGEGIQELAKLSCSFTFASEFIKLNGIGELVTMVDKAQLRQPMVLIFTLVAFQTLMEHGIVSWHTIREDVVKKVIGILEQTYQYEYFHIPVVSRCLCVLKCFLLSCNMHYQIITKYVSPESIIHHFILMRDITKPELVDVIYHALVFINAFISSAVNRQMVLKRVAEMQLSQAVIRSIQQSQGAIDRAIICQLSIYQAYLLNKVKGRMRLSFEKDGEQSEMALRLLPIRAFPDDYHWLRSASQVSVQHWKILGFTCTNPKAEFAETPPGILALDCMVYLARTKPNIYTRLLFAITDNPCPFAQTSVALTRILCQIFQIGKEPSEFGYLTEFIPVLIATKEPFMEVFCITIQLLFKTWREMRASVLDLEKVMRVVTKQITTVLQSETSITLTSFELMRSRLFELSYEKITDTEEKMDATDMVSLSNSFLVSILVTQCKFTQ